MNTKRVIFVFLLVFVGLGFIVSTHLVTEGGVAREPSSGSAGGVADRLEKASAAYNKWQQSVHPPLSNDATGSAREELSRRIKQPLDSASWCPSCAVLRDVLYVEGQLRYVSESNPGRDGAVSLDRTQLHARPVSITPMSASDARRVLLAKEDVIELGYFRPPIAGATYQTFWISFSRFLFAVFATLRPFTLAESALSWVTLTPHDELLTGCSEPKKCVQLPLFEAFTAFFDKIVFVHKDCTPKFIQFFIAGADTRCATGGRGDDAARCTAQLLEFKRHTHIASGLLPNRTVRRSELTCPVLHIVSRASQKYRRLFPYGKLLQALRWYYTHELGCFPSSYYIREYDFSQPVPFATQVEAVYNSTILLAGPGGGAALSLLLPDRGGFLSIQGEKDWYPFGAPVPNIAVEQHKAFEVSPKDPFRPAKPGTDRVTFAVEPWSVVGALRRLHASMRGAAPSS